MAGILRAIAILGSTLWLAHGASGPAWAQQRTTATYNDWTVRCEVKTEAPAQKSCEMVQATQLQGQANPVTQVAIGRAAKSDPLKIVIQVPINVWLPGAVKLLYNEKEPPFTIAFKHCLQTACFADSELRDDLVRKLRALTDNGKLEFKDSTQRDIAIPVSFKGFAQAFDAMAKE